MNPLSLSKWSERHQVVAIILSAGAILALLWFLLLLPMNRQRRAIESDITALSSELAARNFLLGEASLQRKLDDEKAANDKLIKEWMDTAAVLQAYRPTEDMETNTVANIDFKVALFKVRERLRLKAGSLGISLPRNIGVDEAVESNDDAYQRMLQLRVVEKMVDLALDLKIKTVREITPLPPVRHRSGPAREDFFTEYPLELDLFGTADNLHELLSMAMEPGHVFVLRGLRVSPATPTKTELLNIKAVMSALVFLKSPSDMAVGPSAPKSGGRSAPRGH